MATGGEAVARLEDGRVIFVSGAVPDELVSVSIDEQKKRFARGHVVAIVESGAARTELTCAHASSGECGGCDWMHIDPSHQRDFKTAIVDEQLRRLGKLDEPAVHHHSDPAGLRTTARWLITKGRAGYRGRRTNAGFQADDCAALVPGLQELLIDGRFGDATEVMVRASVATGQRIAVVSGSTAGVQVPDDVLVASADDPSDASIEDLVAGRRWRISAGSFFQTSDQGAETLVSAVDDALDGVDGPVVDLYSGVGLLGGGAAADRLHTSVESNASAVDDARHNLGDQSRVVQERVERWVPDTAFASVIADPARAGLAASGVAVIDQTDARRLVLVSCDPASLGRDTALLRADGWSHQGSVVVDMFPTTSRIEVVTRFDRG